MGAALIESQNTEKAMPNKREESAERIEKELRNYTANTLAEPPLNPAQLFYLREIHIDRRITSRGSFQGHLAILTKPVFRKLFSLCTPRLIIEDAKERMEENVRMMQCSDSSMNVNWDPRQTLAAVAKLSNWSRHSR